ncbi:response regulator transcription factor [Frankia canadensis]|uniref:response regulator transcription factor n=1 Tax=Frankia canadensis TaxID=1836972 RepID=UPI0024350F1A|nr:response regulator transcription factor [Frankia canadensis]
MTSTGSPSAAPPATTVLLVDDQPLLRMGFRMVLDSQADITVVGEAGDGTEAVALTAALRPDVVLMDVRMPGMNGIEATGRIVAAGSASRVLILTTFDLDEYAFAGLRAGASGFLLKDVPPADLLSAIRAVATGDAVVAPSITRRLLDAFAHRLPDAAAPAGSTGSGTGGSGMPATGTEVTATSGTGITGPGSSPEDQPAGRSRDRRLDRLTERERDVLDEVAAGYSNAEIAARLVLSEATVKTHVGRILAKLELRDRVQAVVFAYETGVVHPSANPPRPD